MDVLTFSKGEFLFNAEALSLRAAAKLRKFADEKTERIFERVFQKHYELPWDYLPPPELDPHQVKGVEWILTRKRAYICHAPGAGKTATAILAAVIAGTSVTTPSLLIVPPSLSENWKREIAKFASPFARSVSIIPTSAKRSAMRWRAAFVICPDSMLAKPWVQERLQKIPWLLIAVDEFSRFKDPFAERSLAFYGGRSGNKKFPGIFRKAHHVVGLDGSPMPNRPIELWAPTYALHPQAVECMSYDEFGYRYCGAKPNERGQWEYKFSSHEKELREKLRADFMHVVTEGELTHPERRRSMVFMDRDVRSKEQKTWERSHLTSLRSVSEVLSQGEMARFRRELGLAKVPWIARYVKDRLESKNESILLFAWHREVVLELFKALYAYRPGPVMGGTPALKREEYFRDFQSGTRRVLIINIAAGGRGHNLQRADRVIFAEWSWSDEANKQCEHRAARRGSEREFVRCEYIVSPGSMDEVTLGSTFTKAERVKKVIG